MGKLNMEHVGYKGSAPATTETVGGQVPILVDQPVPSIQHVRSGRLRAIAAGGLTRMSALPDLPTADEQGLKGYDSTTWFGFFAPAGTPAAVVNRLYDQIKRIMTLPDVRDKFVPSGYDPVAISPQEAITKIRADRAKWGQLMKAAGIEPQSL